MEKKVSYKTIVADIHRSEDSETKRMMKELDCLIGDIKLIMYECKKFKNDRKQGKCDCNIYTLIYLKTRIQDMFVHNIVVFNANGAMPSGIKKYERVHKHAHSLHSVLDYMMSGMLVKNTVESREIERLFDVFESALYPDYVLKKLKKRMRELHTELMKGESNQTID